MTTDFKETAYFRYMKENYEGFITELALFNERINVLLNSQTDEMGYVLKCHLILEHYIDNYLQVAFPMIAKWGDVRLSFNQKLELIKSSNNVFTFYYPAISNLNSIRNKFSHKLNYEVKKGDYKEIEKIMKAWNSALNKPMQEGVHLIGEFTVWACLSIDNLINGIRKHSKEFGIAGYANWLKEMLK